MRKLVMAIATGASMFGLVAAGALGFSDYPTTVSVNGLTTSSAQIQTTLDSFSCDATITDVSFTQTTVGTISEVVITFDSSGETYSCVGDTITAVMSDGDANTQTFTATFPADVVGPVTVTVPGFTFLTDWFGTVTTTISATDAAS